MTDMENKVEEQVQETAAQVEEVKENLEEATKNDFMAAVDETLVRIKPGQTVTGTVVQITDDEVCVNIGYKSDGLIKKSDLCQEDVKLGDEIEVEVVKVNGKAAAFNLQWAAQQLAAAVLRQVEEWRVDGRRHQNLVAGLCQCQQGVGDAGYDAGNEM